MRSHDRKNQKCLIWDSSFLRVAPTELTSARLELITASKILFESCRRHLLVPPRPLLKSSFSIEQLRRKTEESIRKTDTE